MNIESIVNKEIAIHCPTLKEAENLFNMYKIPIIQGRTSWNRTKDMTCYRITKQQDKHYFTFEFCDKNWYEKTGCAIISFEEFYKNIQNTELLEKLNDFTHRDFTENDVYIFPITLCDNRIDVDDEGFSNSALEEMKTMFLGRHGFVGEDVSPARIFYTQIIIDNERKGFFTGKNYAELKAYAFIERNSKNADIIKKIESKEKKEVSISCSANKRTCSICGANTLKNPCSHIKGKIYDNQLCYIALGDITDVYEWSFTDKPQIISKEATTATIIISEIHKNNCEIEVLQYLQRWIIEALNNSQ